MFSILIEFILFLGETFTSQQRFFIVVKTRAIPYGETKPCPTSVFYSCLWFLHNVVKTKVNTLLITTLNCHNVNKLAGSLAYKWIFAHNMDSSALICV